MDYDHRMPTAMSDFLSEPTPLRCPYCKARPKIVYERDPVKVYYCCQGVNHVIRSLKFDTRSEALQDWNTSVLREMKEE